MYGLLHVLPLTFAVVVWACHCLRHHFHHSQSPAVSVDKRNKKLIVFPFSLIGKKIEVPCTDNKIGLEVGKRTKKTSQHVTF